LEYIVQWIIVWMVFRLWLIIISQLFVSIMF
jgi:hypothetical protein